MARISGVNLPVEKRVEIGLTYIQGIGRSTSIKILEECSVDLNTKIKDLTESEVGKIRDAVSTMPLEADLVREHQLARKHYVEVGCYRGTRYTRGLPANGQHTRRNARTLRGKKKTAGSGRKKVDKK